MPVIFHRGTTYHILTPRYPCIFLKRKICTAILRWVRSRKVAFRKADMFPEDDFSQPNAHYFVKLVRHGPAITVVVAKFRTVHDPKTFP